MPNVGRRFHQAIFLDGWLNLDQVKTGQVQCHTLLNAFEGCTSAAAFCNNVCVAGGSLVRTGIVVMAFDELPDRLMLSHNNRKVLSRMRF